MKRLRIILIGLAVLFLGVSIFCLFQPSEPSYQGRKLSDWLTVIVNQPNNLNHDPSLDPKWVAATNAIRSIGTNSIPLLLRWLQATDSPVTARLNRVLNHQSIVRKRFQTAAHLHDLAMGGFCVLGNDGTPAVPTLIDLLAAQDSYQRRRALACLFSIDNDKKKAMPIIFETIHNSDPDVRAAAAFYVHKQYPVLAEKSGVYNLFPKLKKSETNSPATQ